MARGTNRFRHALALALLAAGAGDAWAARLDKTACADLNTELAALLGSGLKEDMDKGPAWGAANLSPERLITINRVVELQGLLEFRCGTPGRNMAKSPNAKPNDKAPADKAGAAKATAKSNGEDADDAAATKPAQKARTMRRKRGSAATSPDMPVVVPVATTPAAQPPHATVPATAPTAATPAKPASVIATTAAMAPPATPAPTATPPAAAPGKPELNKTATAAPPAVAPSQAAKITPVSTTPQGAAEAKKTTPVAPITAPTPAPGQAAATVPGATKSAVQKSAAKKPSRRDSGSAYVSPKDVNPFSLVNGN